jgi:hypothetical protein
MVTRSPNHMCASSCRIAEARRSLADSGAAEAKRWFSVRSTQPAFSIPPWLNSGAKTWSYFPNG